MQAPDAARATHIGTVPSRDRAWRLAAAVAAAGFVACVVSLGWTGYTASDDFFYATAASGWAFHFPYLAQDHWGLRHAVVLPLALAFRWFGEGEATLAVPSLLYTGALLCFSFWLVHRISGYYSALLSVVLLAGVPIFATDASIVVEDAAEATFILVSLLIFCYATHGKRIPLYILSGVAAGIGFLTRETTLCLLALYAILFVFDYGNFRAGFVWMGIGFVGVVSLDTCLLWWASGDPLYRVHASLSGISHDNPALAAHFRTSAGLNRFGSIATARWLQPLVVLFLNQDFGLIFWLAIPLSVRLIFQEARSEQRDVLRLLVGFAAVWVIVLGYGFLFLWVVPRYFSVVAVALAIPLAIALERMFRSGHRILAGILIASLLSSDVLLIGAQNRDPLFAERALVTFLRSRPGETVSTDPGTFQGAEWLLSINGQAGRVVVQPPKPGHIYFFDHPWRGIPAGWTVTAPQPQWVVLARYVSTRGIVARVAIQLGIVRLLPAAFAAKLAPPIRVATAYLVPTQNPH